MSDIERKYREYFEGIGTDTISKEAQIELMKRPQSWNRFYERAIFNTIASAELAKGESRFYKEYFENVHERISYKSMETVVNKMKEADVRLIFANDQLLLENNKVEKITLLTWLADLFPKYG